MSLLELFKIESVLTFVLAFFRIAGIFFIAPMLGNKAVPPQVQIALSLMITLLLMPFLKFNDPMALQSDLYLIKIIAQEVMIGVIIGFAAAVIFAVVQVAGEVLGMKMGFAIAQIVDPSNEGSSGLLTSFFVLVGGLMFLYLNGHHTMLQALSDSFKFIPIGNEITLNAGVVLVDFLAKVFAVGIKIAAPVLIVMSLLYLLFGLITKLAPQMNIYFGVGFIIGPVVGLLTLMISLPLFRVLLTNMTEGLGPDLIRVIRTMKGG